MYCNFYFYLYVPCIHRSANNVHFRFCHWIIFADKTFTADINTNAALSWTTSLTDFFSVRQPVNLEIIYEVQGGSIIPNFKDSKYIFDNMSQDVKDIHITVIRVNTTDAGLYSADTGGKIDGCCLLIVTGMISTLSYSIYANFNSSKCAFRFQFWDK